MNNYKCIICESIEFSDFNNRAKVKCNRCGSLERDRSLFIILNDLMNSIENPKILHINPNLSMDKSKLRENESYHQGYLNTSGKFQIIRASETIYQGLMETNSLEKLRNQYDIIVFSHVLEKIEQSNEAIQDLLSSLIKSSGIIICQLKITSVATAELAKDNYTRRIQSSKNALTINSEEQKFFSLANVVEQLKELAGCVRYLDSEFFFKNIPNVLDIRASASKINSDTIFFLADKSENIEVLNLYEFLINAEHFETEKMALLFIEECLSAGAFDKSLITNNKYIDTSKNTSFVRLKVKTLRGLKLFDEALLLAQKHSPFVKEFNEPFLNDLRLDHLSANPDATKNEQYFCVSLANKMILNEVIGKTEKPSKILKISRILSKFHKNNLAITLLQHYLNTCPFEDEEPIEKQIISILENKGSFVEKFKFLKDRHNKYGPSSDLFFLYVSECINLKKFKLASKLTTQWTEENTEEKHQVLLLELLIQQSKFEEANVLLNKLTTNSRKPNQDLENISLMLKMKNPDSNCPLSEIKKTKRYFNDIKIACLCRIHIGEAPYIDCFIKHYEKLGITRFVFIIDRESYEFLPLLDEIYLSSSEVKFFIFDRKEFPKLHLRLFWQREEIRTHCFGHYVLNIDADEFIYNKTDELEFRDLCTGNNSLEMQWLISTDDGKSSKDKKAMFCPQYKSLSYADNTRAITEHTTISNVSMTYHPKILSSANSIYLIHYWGRTLNDSLIRLFLGEGLISGFRRKTQNAEELFGQIRLENHLPDRLKVHAWFSKFATTTEVPNYLENNIKYELEEKLLSIIPDDVQESLKVNYFNYKNKLTQKHKNIYPNIVQVSGPISKFLP